MDHVLCPCNSPGKDSGWTGLPFPFPGALPDPGIEPRSPTLRLSGKESDCSSGASGDLGSIPEMGRSPARGHGNPLQYSCLENPMDKGAWRATVHTVAKSQTKLK